MKVLENGCGDGTLWKENRNFIPKDVSITLSDISKGMLRDARRTLGTNDDRFSFEIFDCHTIPYPNESFDLVIADHVLFYCHDIPQVCSEVQRILKKNGIFLCSTYGQNHMKEINQLVQNFDERIVLSAEKLYERFGMENGCEILSPYFSKIRWLLYDDELFVTDPVPLITYVLSCHGNQNQYLLDRYKDFRSYVKKKTDEGFTISKEAGIFLCTK